MSEFLDGYIHTWRIEFTQRPHIFHYTNIKSLSNIFDSKTLWASESEFLNDYSEMRYVKEVLVKVINIAEELLEDREITFFRQIADDLDGYFEKKSFGNSYSSLFVMSFTENQDSLSLWSNYSSFDGYNIGFSVDNLCNYLSYLQSNKTIFDQYNVGKICYNIEDQKLILYEELRRVYKHYVDKNDDTYHSEALMWAQITVETYSIFFKKPIFVQEEEYRIVFTIYDSNKLKYNVDYRISNGSLIPYLKIPLYYFGNNNQIVLIEDDKHPIQNVTIGPKNNIDISTLGLRQFLKHKGYNFMRDNIYKSQIPLRY